MDDDEVRSVRRFNRAVTQRVGALDDRYLARDRPLGGARLLWEIGPEGADVRRLRARLDLDSGHLSRLLRSLEADRLVTVTARDDDRRVRTVRLTGAGRAERAELDRRSDDQVRALLAPLTAGQRDRLVDAMDTVERLLTAALVGIAPADPGDADARHCLDRYAAELVDRVPGGYDPALGRPVSPDDLRPPAGLLLVATLRSEPVGCGALRLHGTGPAEIKRLWVSPSARGLGLGRRLMGELEDRAARSGAPAVQLETMDVLSEALALYRSAGYREVPAFNDEHYADHWFMKDLC